MRGPGLIKGMAKASLAEIGALYAAREESGLADDPQTSAAMAQRALSLGEPLLAYDICRFGLDKRPGDPRLTQLLGLSLARCGARDQAHQLLERLHGEGSTDEETLGILARVHKDRWLENPGAPEGKASLERSLDLYLRAYETAKGSWSGINAATLAFAAGKATLGRDVAMNVKNQCLVAVGSSPTADFWALATIGEAELLLGNLDEARSWYSRAVAAGAGHGDRASMRRNARLALSASGHERGWLEVALPAPTIAIFSGHMPDTADRQIPRFPEAMSAQVAGAIADRLRTDNIQIAYASAASGADILFHEAMLSLGRETHVVLPEPPERFARASVSEGRSAWFDRFESVLNRAASVIVHSNSSSGLIGYTYNNWMLLGLARLRAKQVEGRLKALALWDGKSGLPGGTASAVSDWTSFGERVEWLEPSSAVSPTWRTLERSRSAQVTAVASGQQRIVSLLFGDAVGFSKLPDECIPAFVEHFLGCVARVLDEQEEKALTRNTWGDGLYFSFGSPRAAGLFALDLCDAIKQIQWGLFGLPEGLSLRIALHCGPAYEVTDPVIRQRNFTGAHVSRAARIEPITPPGSVYASQSFAALCECEGITEFACEYVGRMPLAKKYGEYPTYSVRRRK